MSNKQLVTLDSPINGASPTTLSLLGSAVLSGTTVEFLASKHEDPNWLSENAA